MATQVVILVSHVFRMKRLHEMHLQNFTFSTSIIFLIPDAYHTGLLTKPAVEFVGGDFFTMCFKVVW